MATAVDNHQQSQTDDVPSLLSSMNRFTEILPTFNSRGALFSGITLILTGFFNVIFVAVACGQWDYTDVSYTLVTQLESYYLFPYLVSLLCRSGLTVSAVFRGGSFWGMKLKISFREKILKGWLTGVFLLYLIPDSNKRHDNIGTHTHTKKLN